MAQKVSNKKQLEWQKVTLESREEQGREKLCLMYFIPFLREEIWNKYGKSGNMFNLTGGNMGCPIIYIFLFEIFYN